MIGYDDRERESRTGALLGFLTWVVVPALLWCLVIFGVISAAYAQSQPQSCGGTVGATATAITFGHPPTQFIWICNPSATASLWISATTTAAANTAGSLALGPTAATATTSCATLTPMPTVSIIASAGSTPYTCTYR